MAAAGKEGSSLTKDIKIVVDSTAVSPNMKILVYGQVTKNSIPIPGVDIAWRVLYSGSTTTFTYPIATKVGANFNQDDTTVMSMSHEIAAPGTTWNYLAPTKGVAGSFTIDSKCIVKPIVTQRCAYNKL